MLLTLERKLILIFSIIFIAIAVIGMATFRNNHSIRETDKWMLRTQEVLYESEQILASIQDIVLSSRGFVITGDTTFLQPFINSSNTIERHIINLKTHLSNNPVQKTRIDSLSTLIKERIDISKQNIQLREQKGFEEAQKIIANGKGKYFMDEIRNTINIIQQEESKLLIIRKQYHNKSIDAFNQSLFFLLSIIFILLLIVLFTIRHNMRVRKKSEDAIKEFQYFFDNTNDFLCIANSMGYFEIVNTKFKIEFGYSQDELSNNPFIEFVHPDDIPVTLLEYDKLIAGATTINFVNRYRKKNGSYLTFDWNATPNLVTGKIYCIARDITEQKKAEEQIKEVNKDLESFTYSVSHDLRAPLRIVNGYAEIVVAEYGNAFDEEGKRLLAIILNNAKRMGQLIDDLLNFSRLGKSEPNKQKLDMNKIISEILNEQQLLTDRGKTQINIAELPSANCDKNLIKQVWFNLISNAIKYSSKNETPVIEIGYLNNSNEITFFVKDNGAGFDMQYVDKLFGVFQRLHKLTEFEGTGVGLALVQRIITKHGGKVWAEAEANKGATFFFSLPE